MYRCLDCRHLGLCAPDCPIAPWNQDVSYPAVSSFAFLLRQRRWAGSPVRRVDTEFYSERRERERIPR